MITADWVRLMADHNAVQNAWIVEAAGTVDEAELRADRGLFFGSILATANHILWADRAWLHRLGAGPEPSVPPARNTRITGSGAEWAAERRITDSAILAWAEALEDADCTGEMSWIAGLSGQAMTEEKSVVLTHLFLHQVHHRGQLHAALTGLGVPTRDTDVVARKAGR